MQGFGGSADTRTEDAVSLQKALIEHQLCGVTPTSISSFSVGRGLENTLPLEVVRGAMVIRVNSLTRGHSAVRLVVLEALTNFLNHRITPIVPLRGSISASGDLSPLSYIAGAITGHPDVKVHVLHEGTEKIMFAREAISLFGLEAVGMSGILTAVSCSRISQFADCPLFMRLQSSARRRVSDSSTERPSPPRWRPSLCTTRTCSRSSRRP